MEPQIDAAIHCYMEQFLAILAAHLGVAKNNSRILYQTRRRGLVPCAIRGTIYYSGGADVAPVPSVYVDLLPKYYEEDCKRAYSE